MAKTEGWILNSNQSVRFLKTFLVPVPFPLVTTFETAGTYNKWLWLNSAYITYTWHVLLLWHTYFHTCIYIYIYTDRISSNLYTPDSVSHANCFHSPISYATIPLASVTTIAPHRRGQSAFSGTNNVFVSVHY